MKEWLKKIWNDSVGSSLISAGIVAIISAVFPFIIKAIGITTSIEDAFKAVFTFKINIWLTIGIVIVIMIIRGLIQKQREKNKKAPVLPFVNDFVKGYYQNQIWKWSWQWNPNYKVYYIVDLNIECPNCKEGILNVEILGYRCAKCNFEYPSVYINVDANGVMRQILEDARNKYDYCKEYIGVMPSGVERG